jgi:hypothetical protein
MTFQDMRRQAVTRSCYTMSIRPFAFLLLPWLASAAAGAGDRIEPCKDGVCHGGEDESAALLQSGVAQKTEVLPQNTSLDQVSRHTAQVMLKRATVRKSINTTDVWTQLTGAVEIDQLNESISKATDEALAKMQAQLEKLQKAFPAAAELKEKFKDQWDSIVAGVNVDELKEKVADAKKHAKDKLGEYQDKLQDALKGVDLDSIKTKADEFWNEHQLELPDMEHLQTYFKESGAQAQAAFDDFMKSGNFSSLTDAAQSIASSASSAWDKVKGWFR